MNNCVNFDVVFIKWYLRRMTECSCRLLPNAFWFLNLTSLALFFGLFPSSIFLSFFLSFYLSFFYSVLKFAHSISLSLRSFFQVWSFDEIVLKLTEQQPQQQQQQKQGTAFCCNHKICTPCSTSLLSLSFAPSLSHSGHLFTSIISWNLFVCWGLFVLSVDGVVIFCFCFCFFDIYVCVGIHQSRLFRCRFSADYIVCQVQFSIFPAISFSKCKQTLCFYFSSQQKYNVWVLQFAMHPTG